MNWYFYKIWIPLQIATVLSIIAVCMGYVSINWYIVFAAFFLVGPVGTGVGYHRLFSHRQFTTWKPIEYTIAVLGTLAAYAPVLFWASQHVYHHRHSDDAVDPSSPKQFGFIESFLIWRMRKKALRKISLKNYPVMQLMKDPFLMFLSNHFTKIIYVYAITLLLIDPFWFVNLFIIPAALEHFRTNAISSMSHLSLPFSYRNFETTDNSYNNIIL
jgi:stearoyl-CoA desaturase (delta-9 desaturase)